MLVWLVNVKYSGVTRNDVAANDIAFNAVSVLAACHSRILSHAVELYCLRLFASIPPLTIPLELPDTASRIIGPRSVLA
jgi:hypothetical protein